MIVHEVLQIVTHQEHVEKLLVDDFVMINGFACAGIRHAKLQLHFFPGAKDTWLDAELQRILHVIGNADHQLHPATWAIAGLVGADISVHGAHVVLRCDRGDGGRRLLGIHGGLSLQPRPSKCQVERENNPHASIISPVEASSP